MIKLPTLPGIHGLSSAMRFIDGGRERFIEVVQMAMQNGDELATKWFAIYAEMPPYPRSIVSLDDVCAASGVKPFELVPVVVSTAMRVGMDVGNMVAAFMHPAVIAAHVESATRIDGEHAEINFKDRLAFLQARSLAPLPRNTTVKVNNNVAANANAAAQSLADPSVPAFSDEMHTLTGPRAAVQQQLVEGQVIDPEPATSKPFDFLKTAQG